MDDFAWAALRRREAQALAAFRESALPRLVQLCRRILGTRTVADEIAEEVWLDFVMDYLDEVESAAAIPSYLQTMATRRCLRHRRQEQARTLLTSELRAEESDDSTLRQSHARLELKRLERCLEKLSGRSRTILRLRLHRDHTQDEIGAAMGVSKQYVGRVLQKGLEFVRRCLEQAE